MLFLKSRTTFHQPRPRSETGTSHFPPLFHVWFPKISIQVREKLIPLLISRLVNFLVFPLLVSRLNFVATCIQHITVEQRSAILLMVLGACCWSQRESWNLNRWAFTMGIPVVLTEGKPKFNREEEYYEVPRRKWKVVIASFELRLDYLGKTSHHCVRFKISCETDSIPKQV